MSATRSQGGRIPRPHLPPTPERGIPTTFCRWMPTSTSDEQLREPSSCHQRKRDPPPPLPALFLSANGLAHEPDRSRRHLFGCVRSPLACRNSTLPVAHGSGGQLRHQHVQLSPNRSEMPEVSSWTLYCGSSFLNTLKRACSQPTCCEKER